MTIFISYSHKDEDQKNELIGHLSVLLHGDRELDIWSDDRIEAGADWEPAIEQAMGRATVAILLVSVNFLTSNFITTQELPRLLQRREQDGLIVFPVIAKPCAWQRVPWLTKMNVRPKNGTPVWRDGGAYADEDLALIADEVATALEKMAAAAKPVPAPPADPPDPARSVYIHTFGAPPAGMPPDALQRDWRTHFQFKPRRVPDESIWQTTLLPELHTLANDIAPGQTVRLRGSPTLAVSFALGSLFPEVGRHGLQVDQFYDGQTHLWSTQATPPEGESPPQFSAQTLPGDPTANEGIVIMFANPRQVLAHVVRDVGRYFGQAEAFEQSLLGHGSIHGFKGALVLAAEAATIDKRSLTNGEAVALAHHASDPVRHFKTDLTKLHFFLAVPMALAAFTGHYWNALGLPAQFYEWVGGEQAYAPAWTIPL